MDQGESEDLIRSRIKQWKEKLIDLTRRNRSIYFRPIRSTLNIESPQIDDIFARFAIRERTFGFWDPTLPADTSSADLFDLIDSTKGTIPGDQEMPNPAPPKATEFKTHLTSYRDLRRALRNLYRRSQLDHSERGVRILHLAFGMLHWVDAEASNEEIRSPLILCPVELKYDRAADKFTLAIVDDEEITTNPALRAKMQRDFNWNVPELPEDLFDPDNPFSIGNYFDQIKNNIRDPRWYVMQSVVLSLFSFHKLVMHLDLDRHEDAMARHLLIRTLASGRVSPDLLQDPPNEDELDEIEQPQDCFQILDADSSQRRCIQMAIQGHSFVMRGPPGTGKSQTIANIIAECLARGKTVLFVSEKMAALEVVYKRLQNTQLDEFCLELHSHKASKKEVAQSLGRCLDERLQPRRLPTESDFQGLRNRRHQLNQYVLALHQERRPLQRSVFQVLGELAKLHATPYVPFDWRNTGGLTGEFIEEWENILKQLEPDWYISQEQERFPWYGCVESEYSQAVAQLWSERLINAQKKLSGWAGIASTYAERIGLAPPRAISDVKVLFSVAELLNEGQSAEPVWFESGSIESLLKEALELSQQTDEYWALYRNIVQRCGESFFDLAQGLAQRLKGLWDDYHQLFPECTILSVRQRAERLLEFLLRTREMLDTCLPLVKEWQQQWKGLRDDILSVHRITELSQLAMWCGEQTLRPNSSWLDLTEWKHANDLVDNMEPHFAECNQRRGRLAKCYDDSLFTLTQSELDDLTDRFRSYIRRHLVWRFSSRDRRFVRRISRTGTMLPLLYSDLLEASKLRRFYEHHIESRRGDYVRVLGSYYNGLETNFTEIRGSLKRAREIIGLSQTDIIPESLRQQISLENPASRNLALQGQEVSIEIGRWHDAMNRLSIVPLADGIPALDEMPIDELGGWIDSMEPMLNELLYILSEVLDASKNAADEEVHTIVKNLQAKEQADHICREFATNVDRLKAILGERFDGVNTDWSALINALKWSQQLVNCLADRDSPEELIRYACDPKRNRDMEEQFFEIDADFDEFINELVEQFEPPYPLILRQNLRSQLLESLQNYFQQWYDRREELRAWIFFRNIQQRFSERKLGSFFSELQNRVESSHELIPAFRKSILQSWAEHQMREDKRLSNFRTQSHEALIQQFRKIDRRLIEVTRQRIISLCNQRRPIGNVSSANSEVGILRREASKKRRHLPIRRLFDRIPNLLPLLKPCLMMSPISVAQFIDPDLYKFDLVIFDEASQIHPEDAIGSIYRGSQVIVAGDNRQLPPTDFFTLAAVDDAGDSDAEVIEDLESILDEFRAQFVSESELRWHYRSQRESLIAFSNYRFYDRKLITFPSTQVDDFEEGIEFIHVPEGVYDRGGRRNNIPEAIAVVDRILGHFRQFPDRSLGVVTFNVQQMDTIEDEVERRLRHHPEYAQFFKKEGLESFFVKNLENVQGDERDVMLFSIGFGKDEYGRFTMNFGPLNNPGGERRLNVAITRAREKVIIVSSIHYYDMDIRRTQAEGVLNLYHYLRYAELGRRALEPPPSLLGIAEPESPFEDDVANAIRRMGHDVIHQVGCSGYRIDLGVVDPANPGRFILGVECDGAMYHSAKTSRDRDRLRQEVLEKMGWKIHRVWSPDWIAQREREIQRLKEVIEKSRGLPSPKSGTRQADPLLKKEIVRNSLSLEHYKPLIPEREFARYHFYDHRYHQEIAQFLAEVVSIEGPIHIEPAIQRLMNVCGVFKPGPVKPGPVDYQIGEQIIENCESNGNIERRSDFLWPVVKKQSLPRVYDPEIPESKREIAHIAPEELDAAMLLVIQGSVGIGKESLYHETIKMFGFRVTDNTKTYLERTLERLQNLGRCRVDGNHVSVE